MSELIYEEYTKFFNNSNGEINGQGWIELKEMFDKMTLIEKRKLSKNNPMLYKELTNKNRWREYNI